MVATCGGLAWVAPSAGAAPVGITPGSVKSLKKPAKPKPKCKTVRRRRVRKWVKVKVCSKPVKTTASPSLASGKPRTSGGTSTPAQTQTILVPPSATAAPAPATGSQAGTPRGIALPLGASAWDEPALVNPTTVVLSDSARSLKLSQTQDYIVTCPPGQFNVSGKITIWGGHNVVFENCDEYVSNPAGDWAGYLENQTGTLWVHDVHFGGAHLTGGVQMQEPGATVVFRGVLFDTVYGSYQTNHAECVQTWSGPARFLIDGLECPTTYQGLYLLPNQMGLDDAGDGVGFPQRPDRRKRRLRSVAGERAAIAGGVVAAAQPGERGGLWTKRAA